MAKKGVAVLDIGSSKLRLVIAQKTSGKNFNILGMSEIEYAGFYNGNFIEDEDFYAAINKAIISAEESAQTHISKLYIGLPAEFLCCLVKEGTLSFESKKKITQPDIDLLLNQNNEYKYLSNMTLISADAVYFTVDGKKVASPIGEKGEKLFAQISYHYSSSEIILKINSCLSKLGLASVEYLSTPMCQLQILPQNARTDLAVLIDCGYLTTSVSVIRGDAILYLGSFSLGGAHIMTDLAECLNINYPIAEALKRKLVLSLVPEQDQTIEVAYEGNIKNVPLSLTNEIVCARLDIIAKGIDTCIELSKLDYPKFYPVFLTGGGISLLKGARQYLSKQLSRPVEIIFDDSQILSKPYYSALVTLTETAIKKECSNEKSFLAKLFKK